MPNLLIVEDQPAQREIFKLALEDEYEVRTAANGFEALELLTVWKPDLVITDYAMPGMTGLDLVRKIENGKISGKGKKLIRIILSSACLTPEQEVEARALGVAACIGKPFDLNELKVVVRSIIAKKM